MDLEELRAFVAVAEEGSYLAAADSLGMSRTTLRRKVDALEARAGVALLQGTPRGVVLTDAGHALAAQGRRMMQEMRAVLSSVREIGGEPRGTLRVVLPVGMPPFVMTQLYGVLRVTFPDLDYDVRFSNDPIREPLDDVEVAVHFSDGSPGAAWVSHAILAFQDRLLASREYLASRGCPSSPEDLAQHELLAWLAPGADPHTWPLRGGGHVHVRPKLVSTDAHHVRSCAAAGLGIGYVPDAPIPEPEGAAPLVAVLENRIGKVRTLYVSVPKVLAAVPKLRAVLERTHRYLGSEPG